ncbi:hypothetical protein [Paenibacillus sp. GCM10027626]
MADFFLLFVAPFLVVVLAVGGLFFWGGYTSK